MPPHVKKKGKRISSATDKVSVPPHDLDAQAEELAKEWEASPQNEDLAKQVREVILSKDAIFVDEALCLGLGSMEMAELEPLSGRSKTTPKVKGKTTVNKLHWTELDKADSLTPVASGQNRNKNLYQLLIFETALSCLREKFTIKSVCFQDPCFTENDKKFLQQRGHTVLDWDAAALEVPGGYAIDPQLLSSISTSTMCYLPFLPLTAIVEVISAAKPSLYFGSDLVGTTVQRVLNQNQRIKPMIDHYNSFVLSCDFVSVAALGHAMPEEFGFMWPADLADEKVADRIEERNSMVINAELARWEHIDRMLAGRKLAENASK